MDHPQGAPTVTTTDALPTLPFERLSILDIAPLYRRLQAEHPITRVRTPAGDVAWLVTRYDEVKALLSDERLARSHPDPEHAARISGSALLGGPMGNYASEKADHTHMRRALTPSFSGKRMQMLRPRIDAIVADLLDRMERLPRPADLHEALSFPLPVLVICELLGVPYADRQRFRLWSEGAANLLDQQKASTALRDLGAYMHGLIEQKRRAPAEDVLSDLIAARDERAELSEREIISYAAALLFAGHETTVTRIDFGTLLLCAHPQARQALRENTALTPGVVEEILRMAAPSSGGIPRYAHADVQIAGVTFRRGDAVLLALGAANYDDSAFPEPERFDEARRPNPHLTFGYGPRFCLGASLARVELEAVFSVLFHRFPTLRLAVPLEQLQLRHDLLTGGLAALPVTW
jgi:cytochrome P450